MTCHSCKRPIGQTSYVIVGYLGTYYECEWCFNGTARPAEPELITDTFLPAPDTRIAELQSLDGIIDRLRDE